MSHPVLPAVACCCSGGGRTDCYCGVLCTDCAESGAPSSVCISPVSWGLVYPTLPGVGSGAIIPVAGSLYYFDGSTSLCVDPVDSADIDWTKAYKADECPGVCCLPPTITVAWSGDASIDFTACECTEGLPSCEAAGSVTVTSLQWPFALDESCAYVPDVDYPAAGERTTTGTDAHIVAYCNGATSCTAYDGYVTIKLENFGTMSSVPGGSAWTEDHWAIALTITAVSQVTPSSCCSSLSTRRCWFKGPASAGNPDPRGTYAFEPTASNPDGKWYDPDDGSEICACPFTFSQDVGSITVS